MPNLRAAWMRSVAVAVCLAAPLAPGRAQTAPAPTRVALVIGEGAYKAGPTPAAPNDAGLVAQALAGAGFDVTGARDLDGEGMRRALRDFLDRAGAAGPDGIAVVYFAGRAVQSDGDDYLVPVDALLSRPTDVPIEALRLADFTHALAGLPIQARVVVIDGAYAGGPGQGAPGLALVEAEQGSLVAFNAAPGTAAPASPGPYGAYAQAFVGAMKQGGVPVGEVFDRVRLAVDQSSGGAEMPWDSDRLTRPFTFFDRAPGAPAVASAGLPYASLAKRPLREFPPDQAFDVALARDTVPAYAEFLTAFPADPLARRVRLILAVRREALFWRAAAGSNTPNAYWTYLARYPNGPHASDARRRLSRLAAGAAPPPRFVPLAFDVPPPGPDEPPFGGTIVFLAPDLPPPPPPPVFLLPPIIEAPPRPAPPSAPFLLPIPVPVAVPYVRPPAEPGTIAPPRGAATGYPHPHPYARGPNGDGLVVQAAPEPPAMPHSLPTASPSAPPVPTPAPAHQPPGALPPAIPAPSAPPQNRPAGQPRVAAPDPALPLTVPSAPPALPPRPAPRPVATPLPAVPAEPTPPVAPSHRPHGQGMIPAPGETPPDVAMPPRLPAPSARPPAPSGQGEVPGQASRPPAPPHAAPPLPAPPTVVPPPARLPAPEPARPAPRAEPLPPPPAAGRPRAQPRPEPQDRPGPGRVEPDRAGPPGAPGHPPGPHREGCGHPGEPPCRP